MHRIQVKNFAEKIDFERINQLLDRIENLEKKRGDSVATNTTEKQCMRVKK